MTTIRNLCLRAALMADPDAKSLATLGISANDTGADQRFDDVPRGLRGTPVLVPASKLTRVRKDGFSKIMPSVRG